MDSRTRGRELLLALLRDDAPPFRSDAEWHAAVSAAPASILPFVTYRIQNGRWPRPAPLEASLEEAARASIAMHLRRQATLRRTLAALADASIPVILLKGAALAHQVYPHPALRPMRDLDVWVPPGRLDAAAAAMQRAGLRPARNTYIAVPSARARAAPQRVLEHPQTCVTVELHGRVHSLNGLPWGEFEIAWRDATPWSLDGLDARVQHPEQLLLHVCLHAARIDGLAFGLLAMLDVSMIVTRWTDWNWPRMVAEWEQHRIVPWVLLTLVVARQLVRAKVPADLEAHADLPGNWPAVLGLGKELVQQGDNARLPPALRTAMHGGGGGWLRRRLFEHYWRAPEKRGLATILLEASRLIRHDLFSRMPTYLARWHSGRLRGGALRHAVHLERMRRELDHLIVEGGSLGSPPDYVDAGR